MYFVLTARSKLIISLISLSYKKIVIVFFIFLFVLSHNCARGRFHLSLVDAFQSRLKTNSHFDLRLLLFVMTLIISSITRFIIQKHVIVFSVYISFFKNMVIYSKN